MAAYRDQRSEPLNASEHRMQLGVNSIERVAISTRPSLLSQPMLPWSVGAATPPRLGQPAHISQPRAHAVPHPRQPLTGGPKWGATPKGVLRTLSSRSCASDGDLASRCPARGPARPGLRSPPSISRLPAPDEPGWVAAAAALASGASGFRSSRWDRRVVSWRLGWAEVKFKGQQPVAAGSHRVQRGRLNRADWRLSSRVAAVREAQPAPGRGSHARLARSSGSLFRK